MNDRLMIRKTDDHKAMVVDRMTGKAVSRKFATYLDAWNYIRSL